MPSFERVRAIISCVTGVDESRITQTSTMEQLSIDGLDMEEVVLTIEEEFDVLIVDDTSIRGVADLMMQLQGSMC